MEQKESERKGEGIINLSHFTSASLLAIVA